MSWEPAYSIVGFAKNLLGRTFDELFLDSEILIYPSEAHRLTYTVSGYVLQIVHGNHIQAFPLTRDQFHLFHIVLGTYASVASPNRLIWMLDELRSFGWHTVPEETYFATFLDRVTDLNFSKRYVIQLLILVVMMYRKVFYAQKYIDEFMTKILSYSKFSLATKLMIARFRCVTSNHARALRKAGFFPKDSEEYIFIKAREKKSRVSLENNIQADMLNAFHDGDVDLLLTYIENPDYKIYHNNMIRYLIIRHPLKYKSLINKFTTKDYTYYYSLFCIISGDISEFLKDGKPAPICLYQRSVEIFRKIEMFGFNGIEEPNILSVAIQNFYKLGQWQKALIMINQILNSYSALNNRPVAFSHIKFKMDLLNRKYPLNLIDFCCQCLEMPHLTLEQKQLVQVFLTTGYLFSGDNEKAIESYKKCETYPVLSLEWKRNFLNYVCSRRNGKRTIRPSDDKLVNKIRRMI